MEGVLYIHGMGGSAAEAERFKPLFPESEVVGLDYKSFLPWENRVEICEAAKCLYDRCGVFTLIANSIGAFFSMNAGIGEFVRKAYFISPIVDMEKLILDMMARERVTEDDLRSKGVIGTVSGPDLSWDYLCYVRENPMKWDISTEILYGARDEMTSYETVISFAAERGARVTVMSDGEHWFHTEAQLRFLDDWIKNNRPEAAYDY